MCALKNNTLRTILSILVAILLLNLVACGEATTPEPTKIKKPQKSKPQPTLTFTYTPRKALGFTKSAPKLTWTPISEESTWTPIPNDTSIPLTPTPTKFVTIAPFPERLAIETSDRKITNTPEVKNKCTNDYPNLFLAPEQIFANYQNGISKYDADRILIQTVMNWSKSRDVIDNNIKYRYTITYLGSDVVLAAIVKLGVEHNYSLDAIKKINDQVQAQLFGRQELPFLITIASSDSKNSQKVILPISNMKLTNTLGEQFRTTRYDRIFDDEIDLTNGPEYGHIFFDYISDKGKCSKTIDFLRDTSMFLHCPGIQSGNRTDLLSWSINLSPIIIATYIPTPEPLPTFTPEPTPTLTIEREQIPTPSNSSTDIDIKFWIDLAMFVFELLTFGS